MTNVTPIRRKPAGLAPPRVGSQVSISGARSPLREGQIICPEPYRHEERWYVGGQSERSFRVAWLLLENLLDRPEGWVADPWGGTPHHCASVRYGNCLVVRVMDLRLAEWRR